MDYNDNFTCALSGVEASDESILPDEFADDLGLMPVGWTRIEMHRRLPNPEYAEVQQVKQGIIAATLQQLPKGEQASSSRAVEIQVAAQFAQLEAAISPFLNLKEVIYLAPPELDPALADEFFDIRDRLGLPIPEGDGADDSDDEAAADDTAEEADEDAEVAAPEATVKASADESPKGARA